MALDRTQEVDTTKFPGNPYLQDPAKGLHLIASLLGGRGSIRENRITDSVDALEGACGRLELTDLADALSRLRQILSLLEIPARSRLLSNSAIVGFGGQFSSGKSSILNSLLGSRPQISLPEDLNASTSIATYVMQAPAPQVMACSKKGGEITLDADGLKAISHQFRRKHKINPAQYIEFIGISLPEFPVHGVALLDTPGYNSSDIATRQEYSDGSRSREALNSVDHLVWIIDAKEPQFNPKDRLFIESLNLSGEVTVIVNKCDEKIEIRKSTDPEHSEPINHFRDSFKKAGIPCSSIIPYSARHPEWNDGKGKLIAFLQKVSQGSKSADERRKEVEKILSDIDKKFQDALKHLHIDSINDISACIDGSDNPLALSSLVSFRGLMGFERSNLAKDYEEFTSLAANIRSWVEQRNMA